MSLWDCFIHPREWNDSRFFAAAPTRDQAKRIWWQDLKLLTPKSWVSRISETDLCIRTRWGCELWVVGLDKPQRIEGVSWDGGVVDEYADCKANTFDSNIRPAIADREGWLWFIGVPDWAGPAQAEYQDMFDRASTGIDPEWGAYTWSSADILPAKEIESMRSTMDPRLFQQEVGGLFMVPGGLAFPDFNPKVHATKPTPYEPALPLCWSLDFNINPMCSGVIQHNKGDVRILHELELPDTKTDTAVDTFLGLCEKRGWNLTNLTIYGDSTGNARDSTSGFSDWAIIKNRLRNPAPTARYKVPLGPNSIKDTVNAVNAKLLSADGIVRFSVDPCCKGIIKDLRSALAGTDMERQHHAAWLRYFCHNEFPVNVNRPPGDAVIGSAPSGVH